MDALLSRRISKKMMGDVKKNGDKELQGVDKRAIYWHSVKESANISRSIIHPICSGGHSS
jgi:hypothetical protein